MFSEQQPATGETHSAAAIRSLADECARICQIAPDAHAHATIRAVCRDGTSLGSKAPDRGLLASIDRYEAQYCSGLSSTLCAATRPPATSVDSTATHVDDGAGDESLGRNAWRGVGLLARRSLRC